MQSSLSLTSLLCFTTWINLVQAISGAVNKCPCVAVSKTKVEHFKIKEYTIQKEGVCHFKAIVFQTVAGKTICKDPNDDWANFVILQLKKRQTTTTSAPGPQLQATPTTPSSPTTLPESEPTSTPTTAPGSKPLPVPTSGPGSELLSTPTSAPLPLAPVSEQTSTPTLGPGLEQESHPLSTPTSARPTPGSKPLLTLTSSTPATAPSSRTSLPRSEPTSTPTLAASTTTSTSSVTPASAPSTTITSNLYFSSSTFAKSTPNPTSVSTSAPNNIAGASGTRSASHRIPAKSTRRKTSTRRRSTTRKQNRRKMREWQRRSTKKLM